MQQWSKPTLKGSGGQFYPIWAWTFPQPRSTTDHARHVAEKIDFVSMTKRAQAVGSAINVSHKREMGSISYETCAGVISPTHCSWSPMRSGIDPPMETRLARSSRHMTTPMPREPCSFKWCGLSRKIFGNGDQTAKADGSGISKTLSQSSINCLMSCRLHPS